MKYKDGREHLLFRENKAWITEFFFYTDDGIEPRLVSPVYSCKAKEQTDAIAEAWDSYVKGEETNIYHVPVNLGTTPLNEVIDDERNKKLEELEQLPVQLYFEL